MSLVTWRQLITNALAAQGETWKDVEEVALGRDPWTNEPGSLDRGFDSDFGVAEGCPFTVWTHARVYVPVEYDGAEGVASVSRHPDGQPTPHLG
jgi:hypothetical protein